jgi:benzodiazapine receptor
MRREATPLPGKLLAVSAFAAASFAAAVLGGLATTATTDSAWFRSLETPSWYPPSAAFGIVWTVLYVMVAASGAIAWRRGAPAPALSAWAVQILNLAWTLIFFGLRRPGWALAEIVVLLVAIGVTLAMFLRVDRIAAWLLVPYLAWVPFATTLNGAICWLNR